MADGAATSPHLGLMETEDIARARAAYASIGGDRIERQIFLCAMSEKQKCCSRETGEAAWKFLKRRLRELGLVGSKRAEGGGVQRTKADCLQIFVAGPNDVVWLEGLRTIRAPSPCLSASSRHP